MTKIRGVRADPGGKVTLEFAADGWTVSKPAGFEPSQWLGIGVVACLVLALGAGQIDGAQGLVVGLLALAGLFLIGIVLLMLAELLGTLTGVAWLAGSALTSKGRSKLEREAEAVIDQVSAARPLFIPAARVTAARVTPARGTTAAGDTAVEITLDDGTIQTYRGSGDLATAFRQVLPNYSA